MTPTTPRGLIEVTYEDYAQRYLRTLPLSHSMEATDQARQREITVESFALVVPLRKDLYIFNELLVQYPRKGKKRPGQVVPDNMVVVSNEPIKALSSYNLPLQPVGPFWVMEYVSKSNKRKDYEENLQKYEQELKVPYYLMFYPETQDLTLYRHDGEKYVTVTPNEHGRYPVPQLEMEVAILDGWVRYWYKGELLPLPADLQRKVDQLQRRLAEAEDEVARLRALLEQRPKQD